MSRAPAPLPLLVALSLALLLPACGGGGSSATTTPAGPTCSDGVKNGSETGVDCGGGTCAACAAGKACLVGGDCQSGLCSGNVCQVTPTCADGIKNGAETDVDCGGGTCGACVNGKACAAAGDCQSGLCTGNVCQAAPTCTDGIKNGNETDIDCGGACVPCAAGKACGVPTDCQSGLCSGNVCQAAPTCTDGIKNGNETDVDCGGGTCGQCAAGKACSIAADCAGGAACNAGVCGAPVALPLSATPYGVAHVRLRFSADAFTAPSYTVYRSLSAGVLGAAMAWPAGAATELMDAGLAPATTYYYTVRADGPQGTVSSTQIKVTTEAQIAFTAPPTGFIASWVPPATKLDLGHVHLEWDPYPGANIYEVYRTPVAELVGNQQFTQLLGTPTATTLDDGAVVRGVRYHYFVIAHDTAGGRVSAPANVAASAPGVPLFCENPIVDTVSSAPDVWGAQFFFWGGAGATENHVYVGTNAAAITPVQGGTSAPLDGAPTSLPIVQVRPGYYRMTIPWSTLASFGVGATVYVAAESWQLVAGSHVASLQHATFVVQSAPSSNISDLTATRLNPRTVRLDWSVPAIIGLSGYDVYRLASPTDVPSAANYLGNVGTNTFTDTTAAPGTSYAYQVFALKSRSSFPSNLAEVKTFSDWTPILLPPGSVPFSGTAKIAWSSFNDGTTFKVYGGTALLDSIDFIGNMAALVGVPLSPQPTMSTFSDFGMTFGGAVITIPQAALDSTRSTLYLKKLFGQWWVSEVYPDGTESAKAASLPLIIF